MISGTLAIIYILIPVAAMLANGRIWRKRIAVLPLFGVTALVGFAFLLADVKISNMELRYALDKYDLNGDGEFSTEEQTPEMKKAMDAWSTDSGRSIVPLTGLPATLIIYGFQFAVFAIVRAGRRINRSQEIEQDISPNDRSTPHSNSNHSPAAGHRWI